MSLENPHENDKVIGVIDLGSNSARLMIVRINSQGDTTVLNQIKNMVRLGEEAFQKKNLQKEPMERTIRLIKHFGDMCTSYNTSEIIAIATAAVRDAENGVDFIHKVFKQTGIRFTIVSGSEEARLIYLGVSSGLPDTEKSRLFIDIGGGSTELIVGNSHEYHNLDSVKMGCVRLTNLFFEEDKKSISEKKYQKAQDYVRDIARHSLHRILEFDVQEAIGSSGTIQALTELSKFFDKNEALGTNILTYLGLCTVVSQLCKMSLEERTALPNISASRAEVIVAGAAILQTLMEELGLEYVTASSRNLQHGVVVDYLMRTASENHLKTIPVQEQSVMQLARSCRFEEKHSLYVAKLALQLFDSSKELGFHGEGKNIRDLLYYGAILHDIGIFISFTKHHEHSYYLIRNTEMLGFTTREIEILATSAFFHRKRPTKKYSFYDELDEYTQTIVRLLSLFLTLAEQLDHSHCQLVEKAFFCRKEKVLTLEVVTSEPAPLEYAELERSSKMLEKVFNENVVLEFITL